MEYPELLKAYNDLYLANNQLSSGYEQCRLNLLSQEAHVSEIIEKNAHPIYVDFLIAVVSILIYAQVTKHWLLLQELAFELFCWLSMKFMPAHSFENTCKSCWRAEAVAESLCQNCYNREHGVNYVSGKGRLIERKEEEKKEGFAILKNPDIVKLVHEQKMCASCGLHKPPKSMALDGSINLCNDCYTKETGDPMGAIRDNANF